MDHQEQQTQPRPLYDRELAAAERAVQLAALLTRRLLPASVDKGAMEKTDRTPVTLADLGAQALMTAALRREFPGDGFLGEESAAALREDPALAKRVWDVVCGMEEGEGKDRLLSSVEDMMDAIDRGGSGKGGRSGRVWVMDPVDGTATFMRGQQYVVCLCLLEDGEQKVGVLGCPNLSLAPDGGVISEESVASDGVGVMLSAVKGRGADVRRLTSGALETPRRVHVRTFDDGDLNQVQPVECVASSSMNQQKHQLVAQKLGARYPGTEFWSQQMKYVALTIGGHDVMVRIPRAEWHRTCVWDHAGGHLIYEEAGGKVTDMHGKEIDFGAGRRCYENIGNVAAPKEIHGTVLRAVREVLAQTSPLLTGRNPLD